MESAVGKSYKWIWEEFVRTHAELPEHELKRIHDKWKWLNATT